MKQIDPVKIWSNGEQIDATILKFHVVNDNLESEAQFFYGIGTVEYANNIASPLASGILIMTGKDYTDYETNQYAWDWAASQLKLKIVGEYMPPIQAPLAPIFLDQKS